MVERIKHNILYFITLKLTIDNKKNINKIYSMKKFNLKWRF
jgi:hypothetical protein